MSISWKDENKHLKETLSVSYMYTKYINYENILNIPICKLKHQTRLRKREPRCGQDKMASDVDLRSLLFDSNRVLKGDMREESSQNFRKVCYMTGKCLRIRRKLLTRVYEEINNIGFPPSVDGAVIYVE